MTEESKDAISDPDHETEDVKQEDSPQEQEPPQPLPTDLTSDEAMLINIIRRVARETNDLTESIRKADEKYSVIINSDLIQEAQKDLKSGFDKLLSSMVNSKAF